MRLHHIALALILCASADAAPAINRFTIPLLRVIGCPKEIAPLDTNARFGAALTTFTLDAPSATALGLPAYAGKRILLASAPLAAREKQEQAGCLALLDAQSGASLRVLHAPFPMQVWKMGKLNERYEAMHFGINVSVSPSGKRIFAGCAFGGKGFLLDLSTNRWTEISHPHMMLCRSQNGKAVINNNARLNFGCKAIFTSEEELLLASQTLTYPGQSPGSLAPGTLLYRVTLGPDGQVLKMEDPHKPTTPEAEAAEEADPLQRGTITNRATYRDGFLSFDQQPAMDFHQGRLASTQFGVGFEASYLACAGERHHFYAMKLHPGYRGGSPASNSIPGITRLTLKPRAGSYDDAIAVRSSTNRSCYLDAEDYLSLKREEESSPFQPTNQGWWIGSLGLIDRHQEIGWLCGDSPAKNASGFFHLFRWGSADSCMLTHLRLITNGTQEHHWPLDPFDAVEREQGRFSRDRGWTTFHVDATTGILYAAQNGSRDRSRSAPLVGRIYLFDISKPLTELGWTPASK